MLRKALVAMLNVLQAFKSHYAPADPLRFQAGLEVSTFVDYSLSIKVR